MFMLVVRRGTIPHVACSSFHEELLCLGVRVRMEAAKYREVLPLSCKKCHTYENHRRKRSFPTLQATVNKTVIKRSYSYIYCIYGL